MTLPNALSLARVALALAVFVLGVATPGADPRYWIMLALFGIGVGTDVLDGALARREGGTLLGTILDPAADAALVLGVLLVPALRSLDPAFATVVAVLLVRDAFVLRTRVRLARAGIALPATTLSKAKTALLDLGCASYLLAMATFGYVFVALAYGCLAAGSLLAVVTASRYLPESRRA